VPRLPGEDVISIPLDTEQPPVPEVELRPASPAPKAKPARVTETPGFVAPFTIPTKMKRDETSFQERISQLQEDRNITNVSQQSTSISNLFVDDSASEQVMEKDAGATRQVVADIISTLDSSEIRPAPSATSTPVQSNPRRYYLDVDSFNQVAALGDKAPSLYLDPLLNNAYFIVAEGVVDDPVGPLLCARVTEEEYVNPDTGAREVRGE